MKKIPLTLLAIFMLFLPAIHAFGQGSTSNKGTEFWTVWMDHVDGTGSSMSLYITGDVSTTGTISVADGSYTSNFSVTANQVTIINMPTSAFLGSGGIALQKGIHIVSDKNIVVYAHIYHASRSGATLVLPVNAMGKDYYSINYTQKAPNQAYSVFDIIATEDNTSVEVTPTAALTTGETAGKTFTITLQKGDVYQALSTNDLTGSHIKSVSTNGAPCKKIAVYSGSSWIYITCTPGLTTADNLYQQVYPTASWGKNYITAPLASRGYDVYRIIYSDPTAVVTLNGATIQSASLVNNLYYEFNSTIPNVISSDKPIQVVQYAVTEKATINCGSNNEGIGDPEMIFLTPIEQGLDHVTLYATNNQAIQQSYINVIIPASAASTFTLDGAAYTNFTPVSGNTTYSYAQIPVTSGATHNIAASTPFNAIVYGFGPFESYGYAAGTDLKNLNEYVELKNPQTNTTITNGCAGTPYNLTLTVPYPVQTINWNFKDGNPPITETAVQSGPPVVKGSQTLYTYQYSKPVTFNTSGNYVIIATVLNPSADNCGSNEDIELDYTISDVPAAKFSAPIKACPNVPVNFTDLTDFKGVGTGTWVWDFSDAANSTIDNPSIVKTQQASHTFIKPHDYLVTLTVTNANGCSSSYPQIIHINSLPQAAFSYSSPDCETRDVIFTDASTPGDTANTTWLWDFGDGTTPQPRTDNLPFIHQFPSANTYNVSLTVTGAAGCQSAPQIQQVVIHPLPQVAFTLPDACLNDTPQFTDNSTIADGTESAFTYLWTFGDINPANGQPYVSTAKNPTHHYNLAGTYQVTLKVTSQYNCSVTSPPATMTVNGANPVADFSVDKTTICSSEDAVFTNKASVSFGYITQIKMYWDYDMDKTNFTIFDKSQSVFHSKLTHNYGVFNSPVSKTYTVVMEAYSGSSASCVTVSAPQKITIDANPTITVTPLANMCQESGVQNIIVQTNGYNGSGTFTGAIITNGNAGTADNSFVTTGGTFDPALSGPGKFRIYYNFTDNNTCGYSTNFDVVVHPTPKVNAGADFTMLEGGSVRIKATASGNEPLTYKWTLADGSPAIYLDHDNVKQPITSAIDNISYKLTVTSVDSCTAYSTVNITVLKTPVVPNTFTPNGDGVNDTWYIKYLETYPNCTVDIYNRLGEKLYSSIGYPIPWDGTYQGKPLPVATYYYIINPKSGRKVISGSVTIIR